MAIRIVEQGDQRPGDFKPYVTSVDLFVDVEDGRTVQIAPAGSVVTAQKFRDAGATPPAAQTKDQPMMETRSEPPDGAGPNVHTAEVADPGEDAATEDAEKVDEAHKAAGPGQVRTAKPRRPAG